MDSTIKDINLPPQLVSVMTEGGWSPISARGPGRNRIRCRSSDVPLASNISGTAELGPPIFTTAAENSGYTTGNDYTDILMETPFNCDQAWRSATALSRS